MKDERGTDRDGAVEALGVDWIGKVSHEGVQDVHELEGLVSIPRELDVIV